ncbi:MAG: FAD/FMN-containing dehydrogenase [Planctomycetota bacterium]|jgi:FAD/FMN-containing dehydrogenase
MNQIIESLVSALEADGHKLQALSENGCPGVLPVITPESEEAAMQLVERAATEKVRVLPIGLGGRLSWCRPEVFEAEQPPTLAVSLRKLQRVVAYEPGDGTLTAQVGCRMDALAEQVAAGGHRLTPDIGKPHRATLGGVVIAGQSGVDRGRFGPTRHHVLGMRYLNGDGTCIKTGGRLVKNVTGFDLHRLLCGSRGSLGMALELSLRLFPLPEQEALLAIEGTASRDLVELADRIARLDIMPDLLTLQSMNDAGRPTRWKLWIAYGGQAEVVTSAKQVALETLVGSSFEAEEHSPAQARARRLSLRDATAAPGQWPHIRLSCFPSRGADAINTFTTFAETHGWDFGVIASPSVATIDIRLAEAARSEPAELASELQELRDLLSAAEIRVDPIDLPAAVCNALAHDGSEAAQRWMHALSLELDPGRRFASTAFPACSPATEAPV